MTASIFTGVHNFFHSGTWDAVQLAGGIVIVLFWLATIAWVRKDARRRIADAWLVALATLIGAIPPFLGPLIYMLFRPPEYLEDVRERELEIKAIESRLGGAGGALQGLRLRGRARLPRLPGLHDEAPRGVHTSAAGRSSRPGRSARTARRRCRSSLAGGADASDRPRRPAAAARSSG